MKKKIEIPEGYVLDSIDKSTGEAIFKSVEKSEQEKKDERLDELMLLPTVRILQELNSNLIIGGSISLYLQGVRLKRFESGGIDYDITLPFYQIIDSISKISITDGEDRPSGSDYGETLLINGVKADIRIDPTQKYKVLDYKGFKYKIVPLETIIKAKVEYSLTKWGLKHKQDLQEMILNKNK